ncbi:MAG TPA: DUF2637 domain-containing protein [Asanoa sp.]|nr:DUF2637 domain-containing protein [Asanoa sp.]
MLALGIGASLVANVLHAQDRLIAQCISAWPPLALLLTVELISRVPVHTRRLAGARIATTATIAGIAAWVSYFHMVAVCQRYGESTSAAHLMPVSVDGLIVVASICLAELGPRARPAPAPETAAATEPAPARARAPRTRRAAGSIAPAVRAAVRDRPDVTVPELVNLTGGSHRYVARLLAAEQGATA